MKVERFLKSFFCFLFSSCLILNSILTASVFAEVKLPTGREDEFGENNIVFYNPNGQRKPCTHQGTGGTLDGDGQIEKIWNYITNLNIDGLSNNPAAISGIIANMKTESGFNPFATRGSNGCRGIIQWCFFEAGYNPEFKEIMKDYDQYFNPANNYNLSKIDPKIVDEALLLELDILFKIKPKGTANISSFIDHLKSPSETTGIAGARAYADLFVVLVGRGVGGQDDIEDPAVKNISIKLNKGHVEKYQAAATRRQYAEEIYKTYTPKAGGNNLVDTTNGIDQSSDADKNKDDKKEDNNKKKDKKKEDKKKKNKADENSDATTQPENTTPTNTGVIWGNDGFISGGLPGYQKEEPGPGWSYDTDSERKTFKTKDGRPNKILLHSTEGYSQDPRSGLNIYGGAQERHFAPHFTLDAINKTISQHYSINTSSTATRTGDLAGTIQIEIVGVAFPTKDHLKLKSKYNFFLKNFTDNEWDYIALVLIAISEHTGIPLTTSVGWDSSNYKRIQDKNEFLNMVGIVGHMHSPPPDNHGDPGNIWPQLTAAFSRNPSAAKFQNGQTYIDDGCFEDTDNNGNVNIGQLVDGGFKTVEEARKGVMDEYLSIEPRSHIAGNKAGNDYLDSYGIPYVSGGEDGCFSDLENCVSFSKWFINRFIKKEKDRILGPIGNGDQVVQTLKKYGFETGTVPKVYAIFSVKKGSPVGGITYGHTGVVLGIDKARGKIIIGEAGCGSPKKFTDAKEKELSEFINHGYTFAYADVNF